MVTLFETFTAIQHFVLLQANTPPQESLPVVFGAAIIPFGLSLLAWADFALDGGHTDGTSAGYVSVLVGGMGFVWGILFLYPLSVTAAVVVGIFGFLFVDAGWHTITNSELGGHGMLNFGMAGVTAIVAISFSITSGTLLLALVTWSFVAALLAFGGFCYWGTDSWRRFFVGICYLDGAITASLYGILLVLGWVGFGLPF